MANPYTFTCNSSKRPWAATVTGLGYHCAKQGGRFADALNVLPQRKFGFTLAGGGANIAKAFGQEDTYDLAFSADGIFELWTPIDGYQFFTAHRGQAEMLDNPFPRDWSSYMRTCGCTYEDVWRHAWLFLQQQAEDWKSKLSSWAYEAEQYVPHPSLPTNQTLDDVGDLEQVSL